jgi:hypothetical protein
MATTPSPASWMFTPEVTDLVGQPLPPTADFNVPPPAEIGQVVAAWTPARTDKPSRPWWVKLITLVAVPVAFYFIASGLIQRQISSRSDREAAEILLILVMFIVVAIAAWLAFGRVSQFIWYVGKEGMARARVGRPDKPQTVLRFADARDLRAGQTRQYINGIYAGTNYDYTWYGADASKLLKLKGSYYGRKRAASTNNAYRFAAVGEAMWNAHYLGRAEEELNRTGSLTFPVNRKDFVRISPERLEFFMRGEEVAIDRTDIAGISLSSGTFTVRHKDAKWYKRGGKYSFNYAAMSNAQIFLIALEKLLGYRFE